MTEHSEHMSHVKGTPCDLNILLLWCNRRLPMFTNVTVCSHWSYSFDSAHMKLNSMLYNISEKHAWLGVSDAFVRFYSDKRNNFTEGHTDSTVSC